MEIPLPSIPLPSTPNKYVPSEITPGDGELTENEASYILQTTLSKTTKSKPEYPRIVEFINAFVACKSIEQASAEIGVHRKVGFVWRHKKDVARAIQKLTDLSLVKYGFDAGEIVERVKEFVDFDPLDLQNPDGTFKKNLNDIPPERRRALKKLKVRNMYSTQKDINGIESSIIIGEVIEYEFHDKLKATELLGREKDTFKSTTKVEHGLTKDMANILLESNKRAEDRLITLTPDGERCD